MIPWQELLNTLKTIYLVATNPDPQRRQGSVGQFQSEFLAALQTFKMQSALQRGDPLSRFLFQHPVWSLILASLLPQVLGSAINILYNSAEIIGHLNPSQKMRFADFLVIYNVVFFPLGIGAFFLRLRKFIFGNSSARFAEAEKIPRALFWATSIGWLPGALLFPWYLTKVGTPLLSAAESSPLFFHFGLSFVLAWTISLCFSQLLALMVTLEVFLPKSPAHLISLQGHQKLIRALPMIASLLPNISVLILLWMRSSEPTDPETPFRMLLTLLLLLGVIAIGFAHTLRNRLEQDLAILTER
jgi:hypothetical protein